MVSSDTQLRTRKFSKREWDIRRPMINMYERETLRQIRRKKRRRRGRDSNATS